MDGSCIIAWTVERPGCGLQVRVTEPLLQALRMTEDGGLRLLEGKIGTRRLQQDAYSPTGVIKRRLTEQGDIRIIEHTKATWTKE